MALHRSCPSQGSTAANRHGATHRLVATATSVQPDDGGEAWERRATPGGPACTEKSGISVEGGRTKKAWGGVEVPRRCIYTRTVSEQKRGGG